MGATNQSNIIYYNDPNNFDSSLSRLDQKKLIFFISNNLISKGSEKTIKNILKK